MTGTAALVLAGTVTAPVFVTPLLDDSVGGDSGNDGSNRSNEPAGQFVEWSVGANVQMYARFLKVITAIVRGTGGAGSLDSVSDTSRRMSH